ncbi:hypothetical protein Bbelb_263990 [Branchiostoma belcheri]|nr:hypothetical protein Bbelb_263990 [Branchiostoma belcheri]
MDGIANNVDIARGWDGNGIRAALSRARVRARRRAARCEGLGQRGQQGESKQHPVGVEKEFGAADPAMGGCGVPVLIPMIPWCPILPWHWLSGSEFLLHPYTRSISLSVCSPISGHFATFFTRSTPRLEQCQTPKYTLNSSGQVRSGRLAELSTPQKHDPMTGNAIPRNGGSLCQVCAEVILDLRRLSPAVLESVRCFRAEKPFANRRITSTV